jgi:hypothetical protein
VRKNKADPTLAKAIASHRIVLQAPINFTNKCAAVFISPSQQVWKFSSHPARMLYQVEYGNIVRFVKRHFIEMKNHFARHGWNGGHVSRHILA